MGVPFVKRQNTKHYGDMSSPLLPEHGLKVFDSEITVHVTKTRV